MREGRKRVEEDRREGGKRLEEDRREGGKGKIRGN